MNGELNRDTELGNLAQERLNRDIDDALRAIEMKNGLLQQMEKEDVINSTNFIRIN